MNFSERLQEVCEKKNSHLVIGLDPDMDRLPAFLMDFESPFLEFNKSIIHATSDIVCAYKINTAFYEMYGVQGWRAIRKTVEIVPDDTLVILDGKRADVPHSSQKYAEALFRELRADAVTVNPYLGHDAVEPFLARKEQGAFLLCLTSNPGAQDFQLLRVGEHFLFELVAQKATRWNRNGNLGLVVGATQAGYISRVREAAPDLWFLLPGVGAQGGSLEQSVREALRKDGSGFLITVSRSVLYASDDMDFAEAARKVALDYRNRINAAKHS